MSRPNHSPRLHTPRPPSWAWSGVVLFSTLLLSPVASANLLSALARALPQWAASAQQTPFAPNPAPANAPMQTPPRRPSEEESGTRVLLHSVLEERDAAADETVTPQDAAGLRASVRRVSAVPPGGFYVATPVFPPAPEGDAPLSACVRLRASRAPPLM